MKFGAVPYTQALGGILAHSLQVGDRRWKKGRVLNAADIEALAAAGIDQVVVARLEANELGEDAAAERLAHALAGDGIEVGAAFTGRCNLYARSRGLAVLDQQVLQRINRLDESLTVATLPAHTPVEPGQMLATVKIIPFGVAQATVDAAVQQASAAPLRVAAFRPRRVALIMTRLPQTSPALLEKTARVARQRLEPLGGELMAVRDCPHLEEPLSELIEEALRAGAELILVFGASAIVDRRDVIPAALLRAGGEVLRLGMPVDPGNLLMLGRHDAVPVIGLPGCARSPKLNGADWVLNRLFADLPVDAAAIADMGVGGLLQDIPSRPHPRERGQAPTQRLRIAGLVLAAGSSTRMGQANKLLQPWRGEALVRHAVRAVMASGAAPVFLVVGHQADAVARAVADLPVVIVWNPHHTEGLSSSLKAGIRALPGEVDGVLVALGDMPRIDPQDLSRLQTAFNPAEGRVICIPTYQGKRGNPVLLGRQLFADLQRLEGDRGARDLIRKHEELVAEVAVESSGVLLDVDTPAALEQLQQDAAEPVA